MTVSDYKNGNSDSKSAIKRYYDKHPVQAVQAPSTADNESGGSLIGAQALAR